MKLLFIANKSETGGAPKSMQSMILELMKNNDVTVITPKKGLIYNFCIQNNIKVIRTFHDPFLIFSGNKKIKKMIRKLLIPILKIKHWFLNFISIIIVEKSVDINSFDIIHTNFYRDDIGGLISKKYNKVHIVHLREFGDLDYNCISLVKNKIRYLDKFTTKFIAISDVIKKHFINQGINENKIVRIYNGIEVDKIDKYVERKDKKIKMVLVGNLTEEKGQMDILKALLLLDEKQRNNIYVDFYGRADEIYKNKILKFISDNNLNNIKIYKYVDNIYELLKNYDIGLMCSKSEAFGRVTVEYMAAGLLTIASNCGANPEIIQNNYNGFLYDKNNLNSFSSIIEYIILNECDNIRMKAIKTVENNFTHIINAKNINCLYLKCIKGDNV